jgi:hypothetical protein
MLRLARFALDEGTRPPDFGERFPPPVKITVASFDPAFSDIDYMSAALRSSSCPLILWGLAQYPSLCQRGKQAFKLLPLVCGLFAGPQRSLEYAAITCVNRLLNLHARAVSGLLIPRILDRLDSCPAFEYVQALSRVLPCCTQATIEGCIFPLIVRFLGRDEPFQYAVGELFTLARFEQIAPKPELFGYFLGSAVIVNEYLATLIRLAAETGAIAEDWCCRLYPAQLMSAGAANPGIRLGVVKVIVQLREAMHPSTALSFLVSALQWGDESTDVALFLLEQADSIVSAETVQIVPSLHALLARAASSSATSVLSRIPRLLGTNPVVLLADSSPIEPIIAMLGSHADCGVRLALLDSYLLLFARVTGRAVQEALLSAFMNLFENPSRALASRLVDRDTYAFFGPGKLADVVPAFARLIPMLGAWRDVQRSADTFLSFPTRIIHDLWQSVLSSMLDHFTRHCHALARCAAFFLPWLCAKLDPSERGDCCLVLTRYLGRHPYWGVRRLLPLVIGAMADDSATLMLPALMDLLADVVPSVTVAALIACTRLRALSAADSDALRERITQLTAAADDRVRNTAAAVTLQRPPALASAPARSLSSAAPEDSPTLPKFATSLSASSFLTAFRSRRHSASVLGLAVVAKPVRPAALVKPKRRVYGISQLRLGDLGQE